LKIHILCGLAGHGNELGVVVKRKAGNIGAKIPVGFGEEQVLMPCRVIDF